jgi:hypothetical protein
MSHAEAIEIVFDPERTSYRELLEFFFQIHDPTTLNRQGNDIGTSYRPASFYLDEQRRRVAEETIADVDASGLWPGKVVAEVTARALLGGRARASGLPQAVSERLHLAPTFVPLGLCRGGRKRPPASHKRPFARSPRRCLQGCDPKQLRRGSGHAQVSGGCCECAYIAFARNSVEA